MVDSVIASNEDSRRFLLEEASGIMKYRLRRKEAQRKLEMTANDLMRLNDIIEEIARQVRSLKRQMGRAQRYQEVQQQLTRNETWLARKRLEEYKTTIDVLESELESMQAEGIGDDTEGDTIRARIEELRTDMIEVETAYRKAGAVCEDISRQLKTREESILVLRERMDATREALAAARGEIDTTQHRQTQVQKDRVMLEARRSELEQQLGVKRQEFKVAKEAVAGCEEEFERKRSELLEVKQRSFDFAEDTAARRGELDVLQSKIESLQATALTHQKAARSASERAARLAEEIAATTKRLEMAENQRSARQESIAVFERRDEELVAALESQREDRAELRTQLDARRSQRELLQSLAEGFEGFGKGAKALLEHHAAHPALRGNLADLVQAPDGLEKAFDALLHEVVDALLVADLDGALELVRTLRNESLGNATFVYAGAAAGSISPEELRRACEQDGFLGLAMDLLPAEG
jgi:chromosome segregation protein